MNQNRLLSIDRIIVLVVFVAAFIYVYLVFSPVLWFHKIQPTFLVTSDFFFENVKLPGGFSVWLSNLLTQSFHFPIGGAIAFLLLNVTLFGFIYLLLNIFQRNQLNTVLSTFPILLVVTQTSNYHFAFSTVFSILFVILALLPLAKIKNQMIFLIYFLPVAFIVYYISGSGFLWVFSISVTILVLKQNNSIKWLNLGYIFLISYLVIWISNSFILSSTNQYGYFNFSNIQNFSGVIAKVIYYMYIFSIPLSMVGLVLSSKGKRIDLNEKASYKLIYLLYAVMFSIGAVSHFVSFNPEVKKLAKSDYFSFMNNPEKCLEAAISTDNYSFTTNIDYNLSIIRSGTFTSKFFDFFQVSGTDALYPDFRIKNDLMLSVVDFYYEIGDIQEAKFWALESLKEHPFNNRLLKKLVKIELITGNYANAQKYLIILENEFFTTEFVNKYVAYIDDTTLTNSDVEFIQKRNSIPGYAEIPETPLVRFRELLKTNPNNKIAFECMMLYYLLDGDLDGFVEHFNEATNYFVNPVQVYEEAILLYGANNSVSVSEVYNISNASISNFKLFADELKKREGDDRKAMNEMYTDFGKTYFYYYYFVFPQIMKPSYAAKDNAAVEE